MVAVLEALAVELPEADADEELDVALAALAGRLESAVSAEAEADRPVTLVQEEGAAIVPATKFTAAHLKRSQLDYYSHAFNTIWKRTWYKIPSGAS